MHLKVFDCISTRELTWTSILPVKGKLSKHFLNATRIPKSSALRLWAVDEDSKKARHIFSERSSSRLLTAVGGK